MLSTIKSWKGLNIDNKLQMCVSLDTSVGDRVKRMTADERAKDRAGNVQSEINPDYPFLVKLDIQYFILEGSVKVRYEWQHGDVFQDEHKETYRDVVHTNSPEHARLQSTYTHGSGYMEGISSMGSEATDWKDNPVLYEPHCSRTEITIMEAGTRILCPIGYYKGWTFKKADVLPGTSITATKDGDDCYVFFAQNCEVDGNAVSIDTTKKLTSSSVNIKNVSDKLCRLVKIYK